MNDTELLKRTLQIFNALPDEVRHPIVIGHNDDIQALVFALAMASRNGETNTLRTAAEALFVLGYQAGKANGDL